VDWDAAEYDAGYAFVTDYGRDLLDLLDVTPPARVLDVGCGTGVHAGLLAERGFGVVGVDADEAMLQQAREAYPQVRFVVADVQFMHLNEKFDAAISNAALHWMSDQAAALGAIRAALVDGAPFVAEMGGAGNVATVDSALEAATRDLGLTVPPIRKFFPTVAQEARLLEDAGFGISLMQWFPRLTPLAAGQSPADWTRLFRADVWAEVPRDRWPALAAAVDDRCAALRTDPGWSIDYCRLRFVCHAS
jgi:trans-aconitate methyltransferase